MKFDKEKLFTVAAIAAGLGALILLQKATTPHHRRHRPASRGASHPAASRLPQGSSHAHHGPSPQAGRDTVRRSASRAASSRPRERNDAAGGANGRQRSHSRPNPNGARKPSRSPSHAARRPAPGQAHGNEHTRHDDAQPTEAQGAQATSLTVEALSAHYRKEGTLGPVSERLASPDPVAHREFPASSSPPREPHPSQRSPSNVATVGSKSMEALPSSVRAAVAAAAAVAPLELSHQETSPEVQKGSDEERSPEKLQQPPRTARPKRGHHDRNASHTTAHREDAAAQTSVAWFTEDRGTQTEKPDDVVLLADVLTPSRLPTATERTAGPHGEQSVPTIPEDPSELALSPINQHDPTEGLDSSAPTPHDKTNESVKPQRPGDGDGSDSDDSHVHSWRPFIPRYLLLDAERQLNAVIASLYTTAPHNATSWMVLYCYLKEIPAAALEAMHERKRLAPLPDAEVEAVTSPKHTVEGQKEVEGEVRSMLQAGADVAQLQRSPYYFKWKGSRIVRREGDYLAALAAKLAEREAKRLRQAPTTERFAHMLIKDDENEEDAKGVNGLHSASPNGTGHTKGTAPEVALDLQTDADKLAEVVRRYAFVLTQGAATQTENSSPLTDDVLNHSGPVLTDYRTPNNQLQRGRPATESTAVLLQNDRVLHLLRKLAAMQSIDAASAPSTQPPSLFTHLVVEAAREAQELLHQQQQQVLSSSAYPEDTAGTQPRTTYKGVPPPPHGSAACVDVDNEEDKYQAHVYSGLPSPVKGSPSKPSKPSVHVAAFRRGTSSVGLASKTVSASKEKAVHDVVLSGRSSTSGGFHRRNSDNVFERLYTPPVHVQQQQQQQQQPQQRGK